MSHFPTRHAATMIVLRDHEGQIEVLMTRRHADLAILGGNWVFPGGTLAQADQSRAAQERVKGSPHFDLRDLDGAPLLRSLTLALAFAACRETFEETGVLLARREDGAPIGPAQLARLQSERQHIAADPERFPAALARESLQIDLDGLIYWAHWITPSAATRRFDTRFFVARAPDSHALDADTYETTHCAWLAPHEVLERARCEEMRVATPTLYNLEELRACIVRHGTLDELLAALTNRRVATIMPKVLRAPHEHVIVMPWDAQYDAVPGQGVEKSGDFNPTLRALPSRIARHH